MTSWHVKEGFKFFEDIDYELLHVKYILYMYDYPFKVIDENIPIFTFHFASGGIIMSICMHCTWWVHVCIVHDEYMYIVYIVGDEYLYIFYMYSVIFNELLQNVCTGTCNVLVILLLNCKFDSINVCQFFFIQRTMELLNFFYTKNSYDIM